METIEVKVKAFIFDANEKEKLIRLLRIAQIQINLKDCTLISPTEFAIYDKAASYFILQLEGRKENG